MQILTIPTVGRLRRVARHGRPVIWIKIKDTTALEEDLKFSDATVEEVAPTAVVEEKRAAGEI